MTSFLSNEDEAFDIICDKIDSKDYWIFVTDATDLLIEIENKYYKPKTEANLDFEIVLVPDRFFISIAMAHKRRMSFEELQSLMAPYTDERSKKEVGERRYSDNIDLFMLPRFEQSRRHVMEMMFRLQGHILNRQVQKHGLEQTIGTECQYQYMLVAGQEGEQHLRCSEKPTHIIGGFKPSGRPANASLCEKHFAKVSRWAEKQPDLY